MIKSIKPKSGSSTGQPALELDLKPITVFVGPNNSGKSKVLIEIKNEITKATTNVPNLVLDIVSYLSMTENEIRDDIKRLNEPYTSENSADMYVLAN